jgi:hypothetical protein
MINVFTLNNFSFDDSIFDYDWTKESTPKLYGEKRKKKNYKSKRKK